MPVRVILDTDIGTDVDDAWALALCLASPEIDLLGVTLVHGELDIRAMIALKMLKLADRLDVPVYKGLHSPMTPGAPVYWPGHEGDGVDFSDIIHLKAHQEAVDFILETIRDSRGDVTLCSVGPMTNIATAIRTDPAAMSKLNAIVAMATNFAGFGPEAAAPEHNACLDPMATQTVLESGLPILLIGLNVTRQARLHRRDLSRIEGEPFGDYLADMTYRYFPIRGGDFTFMHDPLAVAAIIEPDIIQAEPMTAEVTEDGRVIFGTAQGEGAVLRTAVGVDSQRLEEMLLARISVFRNRA